MTFLLKINLLLGLGVCTQGYQSFEFRDTVGGSGVPSVPQPIKEALGGVNCGLIDEVPNEPRTLTPWNAGIFSKGEDGKLKYLFSGTVIGPSTIITLGRSLWHEDIKKTWKLRVSNGRSLLVGVGLKSTNLDEGDSNSQTAEVMYVRPHTKFNERTRTHDVAIIHLKRPLNLTSPFARAACLPTFQKFDPDADFFDPGTIALHGGFDYHSRVDGFRDLKVVKIIMKNYNYCLEAFRQLNPLPAFYLYCAQILSRKWCNATAGLVLEKDNNLCLFYGSTPVIKIGLPVKHYVVGMNSLFTFRGTDFNCDEKSVNWLSRLNGTLPWITKALLCGRNKWSCENGECIDIEKVCDKKTDCRGENSDEDPVFCRGRNPCSADEFECGAYDNCVSTSKICDSKQDCSNGEDEDEGICGGKFPLVVSRRCKGIQRTEGVKIECENPERKSQVDCSSKGHVGLGVRAKLTCEKYYLPSINRASLTKQCKKNGLWTPAISFLCSPDCGRAKKAINPLIVNGTLTSRDLWPWHVAIFKYNSDVKTYTYICGGSLIHRAGVLTAAHCFLNEENEIEPKTKFKVFLASVSSNYEENLVDPHAEVLGILEINIPDSFSARTFEADLAVVELTNPVVFNDYIRPVCFPTSSEEHKALENFQLSTNSYGQVIGFGIDESLGVSQKLRFTNLPVVSTKDCFDEVKEVPKEFIYCAGYTNGTSVCNGDSGGGMVFQSGTGISPRYFVQGIVSHSPRLLISQLCNSYSYAFFTRVGFYSDWIDDQIHQIEMSKDAACD